MKSIFSLLLTVTFSFLCATSLHAQTAAAPATVQAAAPVVAAQPPAGPQTPAPAPGAAQTVPPAARRPEDETPPVVVAPASAVKPGIFAQAAALLKSREALAGDIASRDKTIAARDKTIADLQAENTRLKTENAAHVAGAQQLETAMQALQGEARTVADTVASLGFEPAKLPGQLTLENTERKSHEISSDEHNLKALQTLGFGKS